MPKKIEITDDRKTVKKVLVFSKKDQEKLEALKKYWEEECGESLSEGHVMRRALNSTHRAILFAK